ncbi:trypsin inhibitor isoform X1 [Drosophila rhopaloa]|uniref:Trypsin inhibitor isoform X1 n=1 Tax=Drosophila rhopaloa TaxID=1041015 RepID=A0A6P4EWP7_DRORH|nr:trypsin inhibitor isoform X1 [Drosophila rhopaloa]
MGQQILWLFPVIIMLYVEFSSGQKAKCDKRPTVTGSCKDYKVRWFYSSSLKECIMFHWGGCDRTENLFENGEECEAYCMGLGEVKSAV